VHHCRTGNRPAWIDFSRLRVQGRGVVGIGDQWPGTISTPSPRHLHAAFTLSRHDLVSVGLADNRGDMAFGDDFAGALGKRLSTSVDSGGFGGTDTAGREISEVKSFIETPRPIQKPA
jgi:hypothetical protein